MTKIHCISHGTPIVSSDTDTISSVSLLLPQRRNLTPFTIIKIVYNGKKTSTGWKKGTSPISIRTIAKEVMATITKLRPNGASKHRRQSAGRNDFNNMITVK